MDVTEEISNEQTRAFLQEYEEFKKHPGAYKRYENFKDALEDVLGEPEHHQPSQHQKSGSRFKRKPLLFTLRAILRASLCAMSCQNVLLNVGVALEALHHALGRGLRLYFLDGILIHKHAHHSLQHLNLTFGVL